MQCQSVLVVGHPQCSEEREEEHSVTTRVHSPHGAQAIPDVPKLQGRRKEGQHTPHTVVLRAHTHTHTHTHTTTHVRAHAHRLAHTTQTETERP